METWYKIVTEIEPEWEEVLSYALRQLGSEGIEIKKKPGEEKQIIISYHSRKPLDGHLQSLSGSLASAFPGRQIDLPLKMESFEPVDWVSKQADSFGVIKIDHRMWIVPPWKADEKLEGLKIIIEPGSAFGTGEHPTTRQCLVGLKKYLRKGSDILDIGAGSGILSIAAVLMGAESAVAIEIDHGAERNATANFKFNNCAKQIEWHTGSIHTFGQKRKYDLIAANILSNTIVTDAEKIKNYGDENSFFIFSGILIEGGDNFLKEMNRKGYRHVESLPEGEWATFTMEIDR